MWAWSVPLLFPQSGCSVGREVIACAVRRSLGCKDYTALEVALLGISRIEGGWRGLGTPLNSIAHAVKIHGLGLEERASGFSA